MLHEGVSFPVGKVDFLHLYPMSFHEFLLAMGENGLAEILQEKRFDIMPLFSNKFIEFLRYYFYVGGMPEAVAAFAENRDWQKTRQIHNKILLAYERDFSKHAPKEIFLGGLTVGSASAPPAVMRIMPLRGSLAALNIPFNYWLKICTGGREVVCSLAS